MSDISISNNPRSVDVSDDDWDSYLKDSYAYDARIRQVRKLLEQSAPMRRKQTSKWLCDVIEKEGITTLDDLKDAVRKSDPSKMSKEQIKDAAVFLGQSEDEPEKQRLLKYLGYLKGEKERAEKRLRELGAL